ncbi:MAG: isoprenylcysteine carboxylmethyltransferase family protein [Hyphomicrobium sp.]|nr:MAG: isoprenylcysteine carboxylmethyltransferase family protein [Hyphomicrobium sp.]
MPIDRILTIAGAMSALLLIAGMIAGRTNSAWRIWPAPPVGSVKSFIFWTLFRTANIAALVIAVERVVSAPFNALTPFRVGLAGIAFLAGIAYVYTLWSLGRKATYCQASGLATEGVYRWTRNPQYSTAILAFTTLGLAAWSLDATGLAGAVVLVYAMMARTEEPWLEARYGTAYLKYKADVPRFFNARHAVSEVRALLSEKVPAFAGGHRNKR